MKYRVIKQIVILTLFYVNSTMLWADNIVLNVPKPRSSFDVAHDYHQRLLLRALEVTQTENETPLIQSTIEMSQGRAIKELSKGTLIDVFWLGTSHTLEADLLAIKIPTTRGLIGYRKFIIRKDKVAQFDKVNSLDDLQKLLACQGTHWPDVDILEHANLPVITTSMYENVFKMLNSNRCDYFPRGYHDAEIELELRKALYPDLMRYDRIILHYPLAVYFFMNKANKALAERVEKGLIMLAKAGEIEQLMMQHPLTKDVYPLKNEMNSLYLDISNPLLPKGRKVTDPTYWILPKDFNIYTH